jgi:hypothetical protein
MPLSLWRTLTIASVAIYVRTFINDNLLVQDVQVIVTSRINVVVYVAGV